MIHGVDVSSYQSATFNTSSLDFAIIKATEGTSYINPKQLDQAAHARGAGLVVGWYHFLRPGDMAAQARYFVEKCGSVEGDLLFADWEDPGVSCADKDRFLAEVKKLRGTTHRVGLYCNRDFWLKRDTTSQAGDALWIAEYDVPAGQPRIEAAWTFHQYTDRPLDTSVGQFTDRAALRAWATKSSSSSTSSGKKPTGGRTTMYTVRAGDTLSGIAATHGTTVAKLAKANGISNPNRIYAGQTLKIVK